MLKSVELFEQARRLIPGGVNSPVRSFAAVGGHPVILSKGCGSCVTDVDGKTYIDYIGSWGPLILGHAPACVAKALAEAIPLGTTFGTLTAGEIEFAQLLCDATPCLEQVRLVSSGTEAVMSVVRLARAVTGRSCIVKFAGGYHGHSDGLLSQAGSGLATCGIPSSPGVPEAFAAQTVTIPFNDIAALKRVLRERGHEIACLLGEPIPGNMGVVLPVPGFWNEVARLVKESGALLVFDEVISGFRAGWTSAQGMLGVTPDLATFGKIIGGGLPVGAYGGRADFMNRIAPAGDVYQAGTLSGNPLAVAAGLATLRELQARPPYARLEALGSRLEKGLRVAAGDVPVMINRVGSLLTLFFHCGQVTDFSSALLSDTKKYSIFFQSCRRRGVLLPPSQFEAWFISAAHDEANIDRTIEVAAEAFREVAG